MPATKKAETRDEYDLADDELTKEMVSEKAGVTLRAVEIWKAEGKLAAEKIRRRDPKTGIVRKILVFKTADVDAFLSSANESTKVPTIDKGPAASIAVRADQQQLINVMGNMLNEFLNASPKMTRLEQLSGKLFLDLEQAAAVSGIAKGKLSEAIHAAETVEDESSRLQRFSGDHGRSVWRTADLEKVIESIPPTPIRKRLMPAAAIEAKAKKGRAKK